MFSSPAALCYTLLALTVGATADVEWRAASSGKACAVYEPAQRSSPTSAVATSWYAAWHATTGFPLSKVSWNKYTHLTYSFALSFSFDAHAYSMLNLVGI
jgi:GH18 family chitinase